jgi:hypothetical protein
MSIFIIMIKIDDRLIIEACESEPTMAKASLRVGMHYNTFIRKAKKLGVYKPNQGAKGVIIPNRAPLTKIPTDEILEGKHPYYQTNKLRVRLIKEGIKDEKCEICGVTDWLGERLAFELDHIDGNSNNHLLDNIRIICPNCHSQTETYRARNIKKQMPE